MIPGKRPAYPGGRAPGLDQRPKQRLERTALVNHLLGRNIELNRNPKPSERKSTMIEYLKGSLEIRNMLTHVTNKLLVASLLGAVVAVSGCGATSSSDAMNIQIGKKFNITGHWTGHLVDVKYGIHSINMTLNDSGGAVTGTMIVPTHECLGDDSNMGLGNMYVWNLKVSGTATQAAEHSDGDNILTPEQENSNSGTVDLETDVISETFLDEAGEEVTIDRQVFFSLSGNSDSLSGRFSGTWIGTDIYCRSGIQGTIALGRG